MLFGGGAKKEGGGGGPGGMGMGNMMEQVSRNAREAGVREEETGKTRPSRPASGLPWRCRPAFMAASVPDVSRVSSRSPAPPQPPGSRATQFKKVQEIQKKTKELQEAMAVARIDGASASGAVKVVMSGEQVGRHRRCRPLPPAPSASAP